MARIRGLGLGGMTNVLVCAHAYLVYQSVAHSWVAVVYALGTHKDRQTYLILQVCT